MTYLHKCRKDLGSNDPIVQRSLIDTFVDKVLISNNAVTAQIHISPKANADSDKVGAGGDTAFEAQTQ